MHLIFIGSLTIVNVFPVDGNWSPWTPWTGCGVTCGMGILTRTRACNSPAPLHGGASCIGPTDESTPCDLYNATACPGK